MVSRDFQASGIARIQRARELARRYPSAGEVLEFYARLTAFQIEILPRAQELDLLQLLLDEVAEFVRKHGTEELKAATKELDTQKFALVITDYLHRKETTSPNSLIARMVLQPFMAAGKFTPVASGENGCPGCGHLPQVAALRPRGHGNAINLVCSLCINEWEYRRGFCPGCCRTDLQNLEFWSAEDFGHVQVQVCRSCNRYIHCVDTSKEIGAIPIVDELAVLPLDVWIRDQGFEKIQLNLAGI